MFLMPGSRARVSPRTYRPIVQTRLSAAGNVSTTSNSLVMAGCKVLYTPAKSGELQVFYVFTAINSNQGQTLQAFGYYGTPASAAPSAGAAVTGIAITAVITPGYGSALMVIPSVMVGTVSVPRGSTCWFDIAYDGQGNSTAVYCNNPQISIIEF